jgi:centromere protein I
VKINALVDDICSDAYQHGLSTAHLGKIVDIITRPNALDQATIGALIRNLYPAGKVPDVVVVNVVASFGHGNAKPSHNVQAALLKWMIMVYDVLENQKILSQLYAVLFNLLDTLALRLVASLGCSCTATNIAV